jgi:hypothetical protein
MDGYPACKMWQEESALVQDETMVTGLQLHLNVSILSSNGHHMTAQKSITTWVMRWFSCFLTTPSAWHQTKDLVHARRQYKLCLQTPTGRHLFLSCLLLSRRSVCVRVRVYAKDRYYCFTPLYDGRMHVLMFWLREAHPLVVLISSFTLELKGNISKATKTPT